MLTVTAVETPQTYEFTVTDGTNTFTYEWVKYQDKIETDGVMIDNPQTKTDYLASCKREAELLAADEIAKLQPPTQLDI